MATKITLEELLKILDKQIQYLTTRVRIKDYDREDLAQELRLKIVEDARNGEGQRKGIGWWFKRLQWHIIYIYRREMKEPLSKSITLETIMEQSENYRDKNRAGIKKDKCNFCGKTFNISALRKIKSDSNYILRICKSCFIKCKED